MTQIGEAVAVSMIKIEDTSQCIICGGSHNKPKKEKLSKTASVEKGWQRKSMQGIFWDDTKTKVVTIHGTIENQKDLMKLIFL